jgi:hypothetical protein
MKILGQNMNSYVVVRGSLLKALKKYPHGKELALKFAMGELFFLTRVQINTFARKTSPR